MTIGIPKALLYYEYGILWETFFTELGCNVVVSDDTNERIFQNGARDSVSECCLPAKAYLGHVRSLLGRCDYILSPFAAKKNSGDTICTRFWGMGDVIRYTYPGVKLLEFAIYGDSQYKNFQRIGKQLGKSSSLAQQAYENAIAAQINHSIKLQAEQNKMLLSSGLKVMVAGRPYVMHDPYIGGIVTNILSELGAVTFFSDRFNRKEALGHSLNISPRLYWTASREAMGAIAAHKREIDGVLMLTVFPCAPDALACEMTVRVINDMPIALILLDGLQGEAGLQTRIESFIDILAERKKHNDRRTIGHLLPSHG